MTLDKIDLDGNALGAQFMSEPDLLRGLTNLRSLYFGQDDYTLKSLPVSFLHGLTSLTTLAIRYSGSISSFTQGFFRDQRELEQLCLNGNKFSTLGASFASLAKLKMLNMKFNRINDTGELAVLETLRNLRSAFFYNNSVCTASWQNASK